MIKKTILLIILIMVLISLIQCCNFKNEKVEFELKLMPIVEPAQYQDLQLVYIPIYTK